MTFEQTLKTYDYALPQELIAQDPARPRFFSFWDGMLILP